MAEVKRQDDVSETSKRHDGVSNYSKIELLQKMQQFDMKAVARVSAHIAELAFDSTCANNAQVQTNGTRRVRQKIPTYTHDNRVA